MKIHFSNTKNVFVVYCSKIVVENAQLDRKIVNVKTCFENDNSKCNMNFDHT